jgi:hypothetical protein
VVIILDVKNRLVSKYVIVVAVRRFTSAEDDCLETGVRSANSTDAAIDRDESLSCSSSSSHAISREFFHGSRSTVAIMTSSLADVCTALDDLHSRVSEVLHLLSHEGAAPVVETHRPLGDVDYGRPG